MIYLQDPVSLINYTFLNPCRLKAKYSEKIMRPMVISNIYTAEHIC